MRSGCHPTLYYSTEVRVWFTPFRWLKIFATFSLGCPTGRPISSSLDAHAKARRRSWISGDSGGSSPAARDRIQLVGWPSTAWRTQFLTEHGLSGTGVDLQQSLPTNLNCMYQR